MAALSLSERDTKALRALMAAQPCPGRPLAEDEVFHHLNTLVAGDVVGAGYVDSSGLVTEQIELNPFGRTGGRFHRSSPGWTEQHGGPFHIGVMVWRRHPSLAESCGVRIDARHDCVAVGFRNGGDHVVQYFWGRTSRFTERDLAMIDLVSPALLRLSRERPTPALPATLTVTERRILNDVASGCSNAEIAEDYSIAVGTVRKHLENTYRKLGVSNRMAAIARVRGTDRPGLDLKERIDRYA